MERYRIVERIAEGTFGEVHKAVAAATGQVVALKRVRLRNVEEGLPNTALREMRALQELDHPNVCRPPRRAFNVRADAAVVPLCVPVLLLWLQIIRLLDFFPQASSLVLVFEFMRTDLDDVRSSSATTDSERVGRSHSGLRLTALGSQVLKAARKPLPEAHVKAYMQMLLKGVAFIHANSIIHRVRTRRTTTVIARG